jgi:hypothetical protein
MFAVYRFWANMASEEAWGRGIGIRISECGMRKDGRRSWEVKKLRS